MSRATRFIPQVWPVGSQRRMNPRTAIDLAVGLIDPLDMLSQHRIFSAPPAGSAFVPGVVSTHGDLQDSTHRGDGVLLLMLCYESVLHLDFREKMLTTFFEMSRSCRVTSNSRFRQRISSSWAV